MSDTDMADTDVLMSPQPEQPSEDNRKKTPMRIKLNLEPKGDNGSIIVSLPKPKLTTPKTPKTPPPDLRKLTSTELKDIEIPAKVYGEFFHQLQIRPERWDFFFTGVLIPARQKRLADLKRFSEACVRNMSYRLLRGFGNRVWQPPKSEQWMRDLEEGEERLVYDRNSGNERFYPILEALWRKMRDTVFVIRPPRKKTGPAPGKRRISAPVRMADDAEAAYEGEPDTELDNKCPNTHKSIRGGIVRRIEEARARLPRQDTEIDSERYLSPDATEEVIVELIVRLQELRADSHPEVFARLWEANIMRLEEGDNLGEEQDHVGEAETTAEDGEESGVRPSMEQPDLPIVAAATQSVLGFSNEPFASQGLPTRPNFPTWTSLPVLLPKMMTVYISTSPVTNIAYQQRAYTWLDAPVQPGDMEAFFRGIVFRVDALRLDEVKGFSFSYGWDDMCRWIENSPGMERDWEIFQSDMRRAADNGVDVWRMKVLVIGR